MRVDSTSAWVAGLLVVVLMGLSGCAGARPQPVRTPGSTATVAAPRLSASVYGVNASVTNRIPPPASRPSSQAVSPSPVATTAGEFGVREATPYKLKPGDPLVIYIRGIFPRDDQIEQIIDERGYINLPHIDAVLAAGKTSSQLESDIQRTYIERKIYRQVTINVVMPSPSYYIHGEVQRPGRFPLVTVTTLLQAIAAAGGYTDYANPKNIRITRGGKVINVNARDLERRPERDMDIESGDVIVVPRSIL